MIQKHTCKAVFLLVGLQFVNVRIMVKINMNVGNAYWILNKYIYEIYVLVVHVDFGTISNLGYFMLQLNQIIAVGTLETDVMLGGFVIELCTVVHWF